MDQREPDWSQLREQSEAQLRVREMEIAQEETEVSNLIDDLMAQLSKAQERQKKALQSRIELIKDQQRHRERDNELFARQSKRDLGGRSPKRHKGSGEGSGGDVDMEGR